MNAFQFSLQATLPIFLLIIIGYVLFQVGILNEGFVKGANKFNFTITLPMFLLKDLASANIREVWDLKYVLFCASVTTICFFSIWFLTRIFMKEKDMRGAFVQGAFRGSAAVLGIAFIQNIYGNVAMAPLMIIGTVPLYNIYAVIVLKVEASEEDQSGTNTKGSQLKATFISVLKNPIILAIFAGIIISLCDIQFPVIVQKTVDNLAVMATPLCLIALGAGFQGRAALKKLKPTMVAAAIKLLIQPAIFLPLGILLGFRNELLVGLVVMLAAPTTASCYIMAKNMHNDAVLTSSIVVFTTLLSSLTLTLWIFILKSLQLI